MENPFIKKAFITGGNGYIGSNLVKRLLADRWEVHIIVRPTSSLDLIGPSADAISLYEYDGSVTSVMNAVECAKPNVVFHLASLFIAQHSPNDIEPLIASNLIFATQLLEAMVANKVRYLVNTGTSWQYFSGPIYEPVNLYAATKQAYEDILRFYLSAHSIKAITLLLFDTYGPHDPRGKLIPLLCSLSKAVDALKMSAGDQLVDLVYIDDVVDAFMKAATLIPTQKSDHMRYSVSSGNQIGLKECVSVFESVTSKSLPIHWGARPYRPREVMVPWSPIDSVPGWEPKISLEAGILKSYISTETE